MNIYDIMLNDNGGKQNNMFAIKFRYRSGQETAKRHKYFKMKTEILKQVENCHDNIFPK